MLWHTGLCQGPDARGQFAAAVNPTVAGVYAALKSFCYALNLGVDAVLRRTTRRFSSTILWAVSCAAAPTTAVAR